MNKALVLCVIIFLVLMSILFYAEFGVGTPSASASQQQNTRATMPTETTEAASAEKEIRAILERYYAIARAGDREALKSFSREISADGYRYSSEFGVMDKQATLRHLDSLDLKFVNANFDDLTIQVHGADAAIAKYRDTSTVKINGVLMTKPTRFTNVWVKEGGAWKIAAEHSSLTNPRELLPRNRFADNLAKK